MVTDLSTYGTAEARTVRLTNALRYQNATTTGWSMLCAASDDEARAIVLDVARRLNLQRTNIAFKRYTGADPNTVKRYKIELVA